MRQAISHHTAHKQPKGRPKQMARALAQARCRRSNSSRENVLPAPFALRSSFSILESCWTAAAPARAASAVRSAARPLHGSCQPPDNPASPPDVKVRRAAGRPGGGGVRWWVMVLVTQPSHTRTRTRRVGTVATCQLGTGLRKTYAGGGAAARLESAWHAHAILPMLACRRLPTGRRAGVCNRDVAAVRRGPT